MAYTDGDVNNVQGVMLESIDDHQDAAINRDVRGSASGVHGSASGVHGSASDVRGSASDVRGSASDVRGSASDVRGSTSTAVDPDSVFLRDQSEPGPSGHRSEPSSSLGLNSDPNSGPRQMRGAAARIAANMEASLSVPTATGFREVPAKLLEVNRKIINGHLGRKMGDRISFTHLIGYAVVRAIADAVPAMNRTFSADDGRPLRR